MALFALSSFYPFYWILISSVKSNDEIMGRPFGLPSLLHFENYVVAWKTAHIGQYFVNSMIVSVCAVIIVLLVGSMASYVLAKVRPNAFLYTYFILGIMIPVHTILIPTFILMKDINLLNTRTGLILLYAVSNLSLTIFVLVGFMKAIPSEIEEAAIMDGAGYSRVFFQIILPISRPSIATVGMLAFLNCWNEYLFAYVLVSNNEIKTLPQGIFMLQGVYATDYGPLTAGIMMGILPVVLIYILFQEQVIEGMTAGSVKG
jgi:raffinose/stachyose/melibiose transport system permease protein